MASVNTAKTPAPDAAPAPEKTSKYTVAVMPVYHDKTRYEIGDEIELTDKQAKRLPNFLKPAAGKEPL